LSAEAELLCNKTELNRCVMIESYWQDNDVLRKSPYLLL